MATDSATYVKTLTSRGWCFSDDNQVEAIIVIQSALKGESCTAESIESELINSDLRSIGGKSLADSSTFRKSSHLQGPIVLQVSSVRDISQSSIADSVGDSSSGRLLRVKLTDGHSEITAIEYSRISSISADTVPGTKIRLENKVIIRSGILCLNPKVVVVLGGVVQSLYEEWQMNKKYSGYSRSTLKPTRNGDSNGPPPFEKLQIVAPTNRQPFSHSSGSTSNRPGPSFVEKDASFSGHRQINRPQNYGTKVDNKDKYTKSNPAIKRAEIPRYQARPRDYAGSTSSSANDDANSAPIVEKTDEKLSSFEARLKEGYAGSTSSSASNDAKSAPLEKTDEKLPNSEARPKEVSESIPVQNQAAAQKLLQKMNQPSWENRNSRGGRRFRGKSREEEDSNIMTLDEFERRKTGANPSTRNEFTHVSNDEDLARQLQNQFDLEEHNVQTAPQMTAAENIKMSMFKFEREEPSDTGFRGRGNSRGRGRGRGRGRARGRGGFG